MKGLFRRVEGGTDMEFLGLVENGNGTHVKEE